MTARERRALAGTGYFSDPLTVDELLAQANGRRRERTLPISAVLDLVAQVEEGKAWAARHAGDVPNAYKYPATTTTALAARIDGVVYVGVKEGPASAASPGRAWKCLQPWGRGDMTGRLRAWTLEPDVVPVPAPSGTS